MNAARPWLSFAILLGLSLWSSPALAYDDTDGDGLIDLYEDYYGTDLLS